MKNLKLNNLKTNNTKDSFLETFRDVGSSVVSTTKEDLLKKGAGDIFGGFSPFGRPQSSGESDAYSADLYQKETGLEKKYRSQWQRAEVIRKEERVLFTRQQKETQEQVRLLQEEIKNLAKATSELASEAKQAEIAAIQEAPTVGKYHLDFFGKLRKLIAALRSQIQESSYWLAAWNKKAKKKNYYWGQFKKSGSKFMLSADRYMSTQAG